MINLNNKYSATIELINAIETVRLELMASKMAGVPECEQLEIYKRLVNLYALLNTQDVKDLIKKAA